MDTRYSIGLMQNITYILYRVEERRNEGEPIRMAASGRSQTRYGVTQ